MVGREIYLKLGFWRDDGRKVVILTRADALGFRSHGTELTEEGYAVQHVSY